MLPEGINLGALGYVVGGRVGNFCRDVCEADSHSAALQPRRQGESGGAHVEAQALVWSALEAEQRHGLTTLFSSIRAGSAAGRPLPWLYISRRFDETSMWLHIPEGIRHEWLRWVFESLESDRFLAEESVRKLIPQLAQATAGLVHILSQRVVLSTAAGLRTLVVVPPVFIQRTSASNVAAALDSYTPLNFRAILADVAPHVPFVLLHMGLDHASSNDRVVREMVDACRIAPNVGLLPCFCGAHEVGNTSKDAPGVRAIISQLYQLSNLLKHTEYRDRWMVAMGIAVRTATPAVHLESAESLPVVTAESRELARFLAGITMFRGHNICGTRDRPSVSWPGSPAETELGRQAEPLANDLVAMWHIDPQNFQRVRHFCGPDCDCAAGADGGTVHKLTATFLACTLHLLPSKTPELGRWTTTAESLAFVTLVVFFGLVGPAAWLHAWPQREADRLALANEGNDNHFVRENTVRLSGLPGKFVPGGFEDRGLTPRSVGFRPSLTLRNPWMPVTPRQPRSKGNQPRYQFSSGVCRFFGADESMLVATVLNVVLIPTDWLLRRLGKLDSAAVSRSSRDPSSASPDGTPLVYRLLDSDRSPLTICLCAYASLAFDRLGTIVALWWRRAGGHPAFWHRWSLRALATLGHQAANIHQRLGIPLQNFPLRLFTVPAALHWSDGQRHARPVIEAQSAPTSSGCLRCYCHWSPTLDL